MSSPWLQELLRLTALVLSLFLLGLLTGHITLFLLMACLIYIGWHLYNLYRFCHWFTQRKKFQPPDAPGIWGEVYYNLYRLQQRTRKRKRKLAEMLKRFRSSTAAMPDAAIVLGEHYEIEWFNRAACQLLGLKKRQDIGQPIANLLRSPAFHHYLTSDHPTDHSIKLSSPMDPEVILRINLVPYPKNQHLLLARDITHLHHLEQMRRDFVANISHELRTPLTVINGFVETMQDAKDEFAQQWQRPLSLMAQQTARMRQLLDDFLLLSRLESEPLMNVEAVDVINLLNALTEEARLLSGELAHHIVMEGNSPPIIYGNAGELRTAFSNIVFNAIRYTPANGNITLRWYQDQQGVHFEVRDNGEGIAPEHLPRLTERFYRADGGRSRKQGGTGLGLAIVKHVLNRHHAQLQIESTVSQGSLFRCNFPLICLNPEVKSLIESD
ncbi:MAG: hypothetical protein BWK79_08620 [Beggiatoa sp. IS2]|nr:MAG: hypothetical protein BWK79_08620 [Beggiatoa sp. IS2]